MTYFGFNRATHVNGTKTLSEFRPVAQSSSPRTCVEMMNGTLHEFDPSMASAPPSWPQIDVTQYRTYCRGAPGAAGAEYHARARPRDEMQPSKPSFLRSERPARPIGPGTELYDCDLVRIIEVT